MDNELNKIFLGALDDFRTPEQKAKDFHISEVVSAPAPVTLVEKHPNDWIKYPVRDQNGSSSCVAQTTAKIVGILAKQKGGEFPVLSAASIYNRRTNKPTEGMIGTNALDIARTHGLTLDSLLPSQLLSEAQLQANIEKGYADDIAQVFRIGSYVQFTPLDFDTLVSTMLTTNKPAMVWFQFYGDEWSPEVPQVLRSTPPFRHSVAAVDACLYNGKRGIVIDDSAHFGGIAQRFITEEFYRARNLFAAYPINLKVASEGIAKPTTIPSAIVSLGMKSDNVRNVQNALKWDGVFPVNVESTGFYGAITARAVKAFAVKYGIVPTDPNGNTFGMVEQAQMRTLLTSI